MERQPALDLFDAFGTREKTLHDNLGGHAGTPWFEVDDAARFFARHLKWGRALRQAERDAAREQADAQCERAAAADQRAHAAEAGQQSSARGVLGVLL
ncbi:hypothetical protein ACFSKW_07385 [Nonomuraea mangrovi]|uniref:Uncharacterized protein n=1 Tax=Nonomuraea mangrovi TaxID=2316207 RepID=A0ABW4SNY7_9ACTN